MGLKCTYCYIQVIGLVNRFFLHYSFLFLQKKIAGYYPVYLNCDLLLLYNSYIMDRKKMI